MGLPAEFQRAQAEYARLKQLVGAGQMTGKQFDAALLASMIEYQGRFWMLGANSSRWYVHDGAGWAEANPPAAPPEHKSATALTRHVDTLAGAAPANARPAPAPMASPGVPFPPSRLPSGGFWFCVDAETPLLSGGSEMRKVSALHPGVWYRGGAVQRDWVRAIDDLGNDGWVAANAIRTCESNRVRGPGPAAPAAIDANVAYNQAKVLETRGDLANARAAYQALVDCPNRQIAASANCNLGNLLRKQGELTAAATALNRAIDAGWPDVIPAATYNLGMVLEQQGDRDGARNAYRAASAAAKQGDPIKTAAKLRSAFLKR